MNFIKGLVQIRNSISNFVFTNIYPTQMNNNNSNFDYVIDHEKILFLKNKLRKYKKSKSVISRLEELTDLSRPTIYKYFTCKKVRFSSALKIYDASLELIHDMEEEDKLRAERTEKFISSQSTI